MGQTLRRIAILNRGEAATRCLRAIRELRAEDGSDLLGIAIYTDPDRFAPFVLEADEAISLGVALRASNGGPLRPAYLDHERVLAALRACRADAVWPGWGFLAEDAGFVERLEAGGLIFLGPSALTMRALGDKVTSKRIAEAAQVPVLPWSDGPVTRDSLDDCADGIGFPLMLKATAGGGGRGIRMVRDGTELAAAFDSASVEAANSFGDGTLFMETCVLEARHVEVQVAADGHGTVLALGLRDCSVQRRHQKIVEESPPPGLSSEITREIGEAAVRLIRQVDYVGVATCEFLLTPEGRFFFLEVNPRLQVEHGVTEALTGFDLVKAQIRIARGDALPADAPQPRGHAIEVRICAEDAAADFAPSPGTISVLDLPAGPGIRVDSGVALGGEIPAAFDSMMAKVIAHGASRDEARTRLIRAVSDLNIVIEGGTSNKGFLLDVLSHPDFRAGKCHTSWLDGAGIATRPEASIDALIVAAILTYRRERITVRQAFFAAAARGRPQQIPPSSGTELDLVYAGDPYRLRVFAIGGWAYRVYLDDRVAEVSLLELGPHRRQLLRDGQRHTILYSESDLELAIEIDARLHRIQRDIGGKVRAPAPALVIEIAVEPGDSIIEGQRLGLLEAMKTETAFFAPVSGKVREVLFRAGERVAAGDVLVMIEPSADEEVASEAWARLELPLEADPLDVFFDGDSPDLSAASASSSRDRGLGVRALNSETRRILMGFDVNPERAERLVDVLGASLEGLSDELRADLVQLTPNVELVAEIEALFNRTPTRLEGDELGPSNDARIAAYLRRMGSEGAGVDPDFLDQLRAVLRHFDVPTLRPCDELERSLLRLFATRTTLELRTRVTVALLHLLIGLGERGETFRRHAGLAGALSSLSLLRGAVPVAVADLAAHAGFVLFEQHERTERQSSSPVDPALTLIEAPDAETLRRVAADVGLSVEEARRFELWRLSEFDLERVDTFEGIYTFVGRGRHQSGDERLFCFAEVDDLGPSTPERPDRSLFDERFQEGIEALRMLQGERDPAHRMQWNRLYVFVRPPVVLSADLLDGTIRRHAPDTGHLGLEQVIVRVASVPEGDLDVPPHLIEVLVGNPSGSQVESSFREPHTRALQPATPYDRRTAAARGRDLVYPYELVRIVTSAPAAEESGPAARIGAGSFVEYDLAGDAVGPVERPPGQNTCGVVIGVISTPTVKYPEGVTRVMILGDPSYGLGALADPECSRIVAAIDLAQRERLPVEWVALSSGARISLDSGTENLDATARVVRRIVTFTDAGGEINVLVPGINVGAQSYFNALATMGLQSRGILIMLSNPRTRSSMVLTGRAALEVSGAVAAEDEIGIGGYERIMAPSGQAQYQARDIRDGYRILLEHYACSYVSPRESTPRRFETADPFDRDPMMDPYDGEEDFETIGEIFSSEANPDRKRPFSMRPLMRALIDRDAGWLERWREWSGAETAIVWDTHLGGHAATVIGIESRSVPRLGHVPNDGPESWTAGTLFPQSSKKVARALNAASGNRPVVLLANLSGFDGSPESMRRNILELGAEIARAVVRFEGSLLFTVVSRYHGGAYVVFSRELNDGMRATALEGSFASVIGGPAAAAAVFSREVRRRANADPQVIAARARVAGATSPAARVTLRAQLEQLIDRVVLERRAGLAAEFDAVHTVERARQVGSLEALIEPSALRSTLIGFVSDASGGSQA